MDEQNPKHKDESSEYEFDFEKVELDSPSTHEWVRVGNQLHCRKHPGMHMSYLPEGADV